MSAPAAFAVESSQPDFAVFADAKNLFRLEYPVGWQEVNKAGATLLLAYLRDADLSGADLSRADLSYATLRGTRRTGATWTGATCPDGRVARTRCRGL